MKAVRQKRVKRLVKQRQYDSMSFGRRGEPGRSTRNLFGWKSLVLWLVVVVALGLGWWLWQARPHVISRTAVDSQVTHKRNEPAATTGKIVDQGTIQDYTPEQARELIRQANPNYQGTPPALKSQLFRYTMEDTNGTIVNVYGRVYVPVVTKGSELPVFAFAPGTTGIDDQCAASVENPVKRNWANYASHMAAYAAQGYVAVVTDYEGMRDPARMHHYMVGALEGRAVLDSVRAVHNLDLTGQSAALDKIFVAGYSQGGHAAFWADRQAAQYAPELTIKGVVGFGPVTDVKTTLTDVTRGANILWFGPYALYSYADWYNEVYPLDKILQPPYSQDLKTDIAKNCIDTNIQYWGNKDINKVYTPAFIQAMRDGTLAQFVPTFNDRLVQNLAADVKTSSRKLINQGKLDNVIFPSQSETARKRLCQLGNSVTFREYGDATHYNTMAKSFQDTLNWMKAVDSGDAVPQNCP